MSRTKWAGAAGLYPSTQMPLSFAPRPVMNEIEYEPTEEDDEQMPLSFASRPVTSESPGEYGNCVAACQIGGGELRECLNSCLEWIDV